MPVGRLRIGWDIAIALQLNVCICAVVLGVTVLFSRNQGLLSGMWNVGFGGLKIRRTAPGLSCEVLEVDVSVLVCRAWK